MQRRIFQWKKIIRWADWFYDLFYSFGWILRNIISSDYFFRTFIFVSFQGIESLLHIFFWNEILSLTQEINILIIPILTFIFILFLKILEPDVVFIIKIFFCIGPFYFWLFLYMTEFIVFLHKFILINT